MVDTREDRKGSGSPESYELMIGGAGNLGGLIDDFAENFSRVVAGWPAALSEQEIRNALRRVLLKYHTEELLGHISTCRS